LYTKEKEGTNLDFHNSEPGELLEDEIIEYGNNSNSTLNTGVIFYSPPTSVNNPTNLNPPIWMYSSPNTNFPEHEKDNSENSTCWNVDEPLLFFNTGNTTDTTMNWQEL